METHFISKLQNEVKHKCDVCDATKILKYVTIDDKGNTLSICEECRDNILKD